MKKNTKGFTLVEIIVTMAISAIAMTIVVGIMVSSFNALGSSANVGEAKLIGDGVYSLIKESLTYATELQIRTDPTEPPVSGHNAMTVSKEDDETKGRLMFQKADTTPWVDLYGEQYYKGSTIKVLTRAYNEYTLDISVIVSNSKGEEMYRTGSTIELVNMKLSGAYITDSDGNKINDGADVNTIPFLDNAVYIYMANN